MSLIYFPGEPIESFVTDLILEQQPQGTKEHGVPRRPADGRVYVNDQRPGSPWASHHNARGRWVCAYGRPTERLEKFLDQVHGRAALADGSLEIIPWDPSEEFPKGATLLIARPGGDMRGISRYFVALEVPEYAGLKAGAEVSAKWWDGRHYQAQVVGRNVGRDRGYRLYFPHAVDHGGYIDVKPEDITPRETHVPEEAGRPDGDAQPDGV